MISFEEFLDSLSDIGSIQRDDPELLEQARRIVEGLRAIGIITRQSLARFVEEHPESVPMLVSCIGLGQEQLRNQLRFRFGHGGWVSLVRTQADKLIQVFDDEYDLVSRVTTQLNRGWTFADVLVERQLWSRRTGVKAVGQGRSVEDEVETVVKALGIPYAMRTRFQGRGGQDAPCDLAIPGGGVKAQVVVALKGFNSTGSKQSDAVREIEEMADVRLPRQHHWQACQWYLRARGGPRHLYAVAGESSHTPNNQTMVLIGD